MAFQLWCIFALLFTACLPKDLEQRAQYALHSDEDHTRLADHDVIEGYDVWTFCRDVRNHGLGPRWVHEACIVITCPPGARALRCDVAP
jgi:hypothetical protein